MNRCWIGVGLVVLTAGCPTPRESVHEPAATSRQPETVTLTRAVAERTGVKWEAARQFALAQTVQAPAEIAFHPDRTAHVSPLAMGRISRVAVAVGDQVKKGENLAWLSSIAGAESRADLVQAEASADQARENLRRQEKLHAAGIGTDRVHLEAITAARRAEAQLAAAKQRAGLTGRMTMRAPIAGTIIERHAIAGEVAEPGRLLFTVADLTRVWVMGRVYERDVGLIRPGMPVRLTLQAYPEDRWEGTLTYVAGALDHATRTLTVRLELDNPDGRLRPGLFGSLDIEVGKTDPVVVVPLAAVQRLGTRDVVFVKTAETAEAVSFMVRGVQTGRSAGDEVEIRDGVAEGDAVVITGGFTLKGELLRDTLSDE